MNLPRIITLLLLLARTIYSSPFSIQQVVLWGHKLHSHTTSYVYYGFEKAFRHMGYQVLWLDNNDPIDHLSLENSLFFTEGVVDQKIPLRDDCFYILHNCKLDKYQHLMKQHRCLILQVYTNAILERELITIDDYTYFEPTTTTLYMPWATDLLPHEIDAIKTEMSHVIKNNTITWIGSTWDGYFGNKSEINRLKSSAHQHGLTFVHHAGVSEQKNVQLIQQSLLAPALQGKWQCEVGYIPCRIFKNISYGALGVTNSKTVFELFKGRIVYDTNIEKLVEKALNKARTITLDEQYALMDFVKGKHTYVTRIKHILGLLEQLQNLRLPN